MSKLDSSSGDGGAATNTAQSASTSAPAFTAAVFSDPEQLIQQADFKELRVYPTTGWHHDIDEVGYSPFGAFPKDMVASHVASAVENDRRANAAVGAVVGMAVADAIGAPLEFLEVVDTPFELDGSGEAHGFTAATMKYTNENNRFELKRGQWTDDAAMGLCMADSLLAHRGFNGSDMRVRFHNWWFHGYNNAFKDSTSVGLGGNISQSLFSMEPGHVPEPLYQSDGQDAGNGSLMRLAPVPVFYWRDLEASMKYSALSSYTTHPGPLAAYACKVLAYLVASAIQEPPDLAQTTPARWLDQQIAVFVEEVLDNAGAGAAATTDADADADAAAAGGGGGGGGGSADGSADGDAVAKLRRLLSTTPEEESSTERCWNWRTAVLPISSAIKNRGRSYNGYPVSRGYFGSFSFDGLAMALHSVYTTTSFSAAVEKCVNFLGDADSTGSMAGQLAGSIYGYTTIDRRMVANLNAWDDHQTALRGLLLYQLAPGGPNA